MGAHFTPHPKVSVDVAAHVQGVRYLRDALSCRRLRALESTHAAVRHEINLSSREGSSWVAGGLIDRV